MVSLLSGDIADISEGDQVSLTCVAAANPPALVVLTHKPADSNKSIAWVGKGIVYDTGGLSIKVGLSTSDVLCSR